MGQRRPASHVHAPAPQDPWLGLSWSWSDTLVVLGFSAGALLGVVSESALVPRGGTDRPVAGAQEGDRERRDRGGSGASRKSSGPCRGSELSLTSPTRLRSSTRELRNYGVHPALVRDDLERLFPEEECGLLTLRTHTCLVRRVAYRGGRVNGRARVVAAGFDTSRGRRGQGLQNSFLKPDAAEDAEGNALKSHVLEIERDERSVIDPPQIRRTVVYTSRECGPVVPSGPRRPRRLERRVATVEGREELSRTSKKPHLSSWPTSGSR